MPTSPSGESNDLKSTSPLVSSKKQPRNAKSRSKSPPKSRSPRKRSKSPKRSNRKSRSTVSNSEASETLKRVTSRRYVYTPEGDDDPVVVERLDLSAQGLTVVANSVLNKVTVNELDLSTNNIRSLAPDVRNMRSLVYLDVSRNPIQCQHPRDYSGLPAELANLPNLRVIIMSECSLSVLPPVIWNCANLIALDVSRNRIGKLPAEVGQLTRLRYLSVQQTGLTTVPAELACCRLLTDLLLWGNPIRVLPASIKYLRELRRLEVTCRSFAVGLDSYMDSLLISGQIQSEHVPPVLLELPSLEVLDLDNTKINQLPSSGTPHRSGASNLIVLSLANNFLPTLPQHVLDMTRLTSLDISNNLLVQLPDDFGHRLTQLEALHLNGNRIVACPASIGNLSQLNLLSMNNNELVRLPAEIGQLKRLKTLLLESNRLTRLPDTLAELTSLETLVLSENRLTQLPVNMHQMTALTSAHAFRKLNKHGLWLHPNKFLNNPPAAIWRSGSTARLFQYLAEQKLSSSAKHIYRQKLFVIGNRGSGKTELVNGLMDRCITSSGERNLSVPRSESALRLWTTPNRISFTVYDMSGCKSDDLLLPVWFDSSGSAALYIVVYNASTLTPDSFHSDVGRWIDLLTLHVPDAVVKFVGTLIDVTNQPEISADDRKLEADRLILDYVNARQSRSQVLDDDAAAEQITEKKEAQSSQTDYQEDFDRAKPGKIRVTGGVTLLGSDSSDIAKLTVEIELIVTNDKLFAENFQAVENADQLEIFVRTLRKQSSGSLTAEWDDVIEAAAAAGLPETSLPRALEFLCSTGELLWFKSISALSGTVFTRPTPLLRVLQQCLRKPSRDQSVDNGQMFLTTSLQNKDNQSFSEAMDKFSSEGLASRSFLLYLLFNLRPTNDDFLEVVDILNRMDLCYIISTSPISVIFPSLMKISKKGTQRRLQPARGKFKLCVRFTFFMLYPTHLLARLSCRLHSLVIRRLVHTPEFFVDDVTESVRLLARMCRHETIYKNSTGELSLEASGSDKEEIDSCLESITRQVESILLLYKGQMFNVTKSDK